MKNMALTKKALEQLLQWGVQDLVICPGGRNSPFVFSLDQKTPFQIHSAFDERAAAFYALGLAQAKNKPAAIITTSGTAVAEVLPAVIEAHYTQTPLIVISADRPQRMRGTGAPQTIDQVGLFSSYVEKCLDISREWPEVSWSRTAPLHLNICFDEPLIDAAALEPLLPQVEILKDSQTLPKNLQLKFSRFLEGKNNPLLLISGLKPHEVPEVEKFALAWPGFIYAESTSGLREMVHPGMITSGDRFPSYLHDTKKIDGVVRLGGVPTARVWRDLETSEMPVFSMSSLPFAGMSRGEFYHTEMIHLESLMESVPERFEFASVDRDKDHELCEQWNLLLAKYPLSEPAMVRWVSSQLTPNTSVYVGNSLPIREWDLAALRETPNHVRANRGANGIDGQIATALALRTKDRDLCVLVGDLTAMYDSNALWFLKNATLKSNCFIMVLNNGGGKIFERLFNRSLFYNTHDLNFKGWAESWQCEYTLINEPTALHRKTGVFEVLPNTEQTSAFWREYDQLFKDRLTL